MIQAIAASQKIIPAPTLPPPKGDIVPRMRGREPQKDAQWIRQFIVHFGRETQIPPESPVGRWLEFLDQATLPAPDALPGRLSDRSLLSAPDTIERFTMFVDYYQAVRLAWAASVFFSQPSSAVSIEQSVVTEELLRCDTTGPGPHVPSIVETLFFAAKLVNGNGGRVQVFGSSSPGTDLVWEPTDGSSVRFERKDRLLRVGFHDSIEQMERWILSKLTEAAEKFPANPTVPRVAVAGAILPLERARQLHARFPDAIRQLILPDPAIPAAVCLHIFGLGFRESVVLDELTNFRYLTSSHDHSIYRAIEPNLRRVFDR